MNNITTFTLSLCTLLALMFGTANIQPASAQGSYYHLQTQCTPAYSGTANYSTPTEMLAGYSYYIFATPQNGFEFLCWEEDGKELSTNPSFYYTMPAHDVTLTARFKFNPDGPGIPSANYYDAETKTLYMDDFTPDSYGTEVMKLMAYPFSDDELETLVVTGEMTANDLLYVDYRNPVTADLSRVNGISEIRLLDYNDNLTTLILPECVEALGNGAFWDLQNLAQLTLHSLIPPTVEESLPEYLNPEKVIVYVPGVSLGIYLAHPVWSKYLLYPISGEVHSLTIGLPEGTIASDYPGCVIDLVNAKNGMKLSCLVSDTTDYVFNNISAKTVWNAYLRSSRNKEIARIENIRVENEDVYVRFPAGGGRKLHTVTVDVKATDGEVLTHDCRIRFFDEDHNYMAEGTQAEGFTQGEKIYIEAALPEKLALTYQPIEEKSYLVNGSNNHVVLEAVPYQKAWLHVHVTDEDTQQPLKDATVSAYQQIVQQLPARLSRETTGADGNATLEVYADFDTDIYASAEGYMSSEAHMEKTDAGQNSNITIALKRNSSEVTALPLTIQATMVAAKGETAETKTATENDIRQLHFQVYNQTRQEEVGNFRMAGTTIYLPEKVEAGNMLTITASVADNSKFVKAAPAQASVTITNSKTANVLLNFVEYGTIDATLRGTKADKTDWGTLYDGDGKKLLSESYMAAKLPSAMRQRMPDGNYTLVTTLQKNAPGDLSGLQGMNEGEDYTRVSFHIESGIILPVSATAPEGKEKEPEFELTSVFSVRKNEYGLGEYVTMTIATDIVTEQEVTDVKLVVELQNYNELLHNSLFSRNGEPVFYTLTGNQLTIPLQESSQKVSFCTLPTFVGKYTPWAYLLYTIDGKTRREEIGSVEFRVVAEGTGMGFSVPEKTTVKEIPIRGWKTFAGSTIKIFDGNVMIGCAKARANGEWNTLVTLAGDQEWHYIHIEVTDIAILPEATIVSDNKAVYFDPTMNIPDKLAFSFYNRWLGKTVTVTYDQQNCSTSVNSYMFFTTAEYTFTALFTKDEPEELNNVVINVWMENGVALPLTASYNATLHQYVATGTFSWGNLPVNMTIDYAYKGETLMVDHTYTATTPCTKNVVPIHDPSGFVYEAVPSNRVEGVTATIYYKETTTDEYGDPVEHIVLWDAENYGQENPLYTNSEGVYRWDVPRGQWQVKFEKAGYQTTVTDWLPVPPPQLEVNIPIVQYTPPRVIQVKAFDDKVEMMFDKYMDVSTLHRDNIFVMAGNETLSGTIELTNKENAGKENNVAYASCVCFVPDNPQLLSRKRELTVIIDKHVMAYNGLSMQQNFKQTFAISPRVKTLDVTSSVEMKSGEDVAVGVTCSPASAAAGKTIIVSTASNLIASVSDNGLPIVCQLNSEGKGMVCIRGVLPGQTMVTFELPDEGLKEEVSVHVIPESEPNGVEEVHAATDANQAVLYSIQGIRINSVPTKGIYIRNHKKFVAR